MNSVIASLPMNPVHENKLGFYSFFVYADRIAHKQNIDTIFGINILGKSIPQDSLLLLKRSTKKLGVQPSMWWIDTLQNINSKQQYLTNLYKKDFIRTEIRDVSTCVCGKVEYLADARLYGNKKTLIKDGKSLCCHTKISTNREMVLVTAPLPQLNTIPSVFPRWAALEFNSKIQKLTGSQLLVSRNTKRIHTIKIKGVMKNLDNDISWWLYSKWLQMKHYHLEELVTASSTLYHAAVCTMISNLTELPTPKKIHCLPKIFFSPIHGVNTLTQAIDRFGKLRVANALLWCALSKRKEFTLSGSIFPEMYDGIPDVPVLESRQHLCK